MQGITELIQQINRKRVKRISILKPNKTGGFHNELYHSILNGSTKSEDEALQLYLKSNKDNSGFAMSKMRFKEKLLNLVLFLDPSSLKTQLGKDQFKINRNLFLGKILPVLGAHNMALSALNKAIISAKKNNQNDSLAEGLKNYLVIAARLGESKNWTEYIELYKAAKHKSLATEQAELIYANILMSSNTNQMSKFSEEQLDKMLEELESCAEVVGNSRTRELHFFAAALLHQHNGSYKELYNISSKFYRYQVKQKGLAKMGRTVALSMQVLSAMHLRKFKEGRNLAERLLDLMPENVMNSIHFREIAFLFYMHAKDYKKAYEVYDFVMNSPLFSRLSELKQEKWRYYKPYISLAQNPTERKTISTNKNELDKFLALKPSFKREADSINAQVRIAQVVYSIALRDENYLIDYADALKVYDRRVLRRRRNTLYERSHHFIQALLCLPKGNFNLKKTNELAQKHINELTINRYNMYQNDHVEIIPYEDLWELINNNLNQES